MVVDFWAPWCGPCRMVGPVLEKLAADHPDKITVVKVNVDENAELAARFAVMSIPTVIMFKGGQSGEADGRCPRSEGLRGGVRSLVHGFVRSEVPLLRQGVRGVSAGLPQRRGQGVPRLRGSRGRAALHRVRRRDRSSAQRRRPVRRAGVASPEVVPRPRVAAAPASATSRRLDGWGSCAKGV